MPATPYRIGSLEKALLLLEKLANHPDSTLADLSRELDSPRAGVFRYLKALESAGYVRQTAGTKRYALGPRLLYLGNAARHQMKLPEIARPLMLSLRERYNETIHIGVLAHGQTIHVEVVSSTHPVKMAAEVGEPAFSHVSALGKALLAWSEPGVVEDAIREWGLPALTPKTIVTRERFAEDLAAIRSRGYSLDDEESALGLRCVAAPIRDSAEQVVAALSLSSPANRLSLQDALALTPSVVATADAISQKLGSGGRETNMKAGKDE